MRLRDVPFILLAPIVAVILWTVPLEAQSCPVPNTCPQDNGCVGGFGGAACGPAHGSDPYCYLSNPDPCKYVNTGCPFSYYTEGACCYRVSSPIIVDLDGKGFHLSDPESGVWFRVFAKSANDYQVAWPAPGVLNGWLALDRNGNGLIDDFSELFGDQIPQPTPPPGQHPNGFAALAVYDSPGHGGNGDGWITKQDAIFDRLLVWVDENHDGVSQPAELHSLDSLSIAGIRLRYTLSEMTDKFGNLFRYKSVIRDSQGGETNRTIYDVLLAVGASREDSSTAGWFATPREVGFTPDEPNTGGAGPGGLE